MKKFLTPLAAALLLLASCEEFEPVFTFKYKEADPAPAWSDEAVLARFGLEKFTTIKELKALYKKHGEPVTIEDNIVIRGEVTTSDESGNVYRELYLQDASGAIDFKIGRSSSYDDYKPGQVLYVNCYGLTLGEYGYKDRDYNGCGLLQLGLARNRSINPSTGEWENFDDYETAYIDLQAILDQKVYKGVVLPEEERVKPAVVSGSDLLSHDYDAIRSGKSPTTFQTQINHPLVGKLALLKGLSYGNNIGGKEVFALFYPNPNLNHTSAEAWNRVFVSSPQDRVSGADYTYGLKWWALTKNRFTQMVENGDQNGWDELEVGSGADRYGPIATTKTTKENFGVVMLYKDMILAHPSAQSVSHYFMYQGSSIQIRTSGYARFADIEIPEAVRSGSATIDALGVITRYQGAAQFTLLDAWLSSDTDHEHSILSAQ